MVRTDRTVKCLSDDTCQREISNPPECKQGHGHLQYKDKVSKCQSRPVLYIVNSFRLSFSSVENIEYVQNETKSLPTTECYLTTPNQESIPMASSGLTYKCSENIRIVTYECSIEALVHVSKLGGKFCKHAK